MKLYSTKSPNKFVSLKEAVLNGLPADNGLYMPLDFAPLPNTFFENITQYSFQEMSFEVCKHFLKGAIPQADLKAIIFDALNFDVPLVRLNDHQYILELFHGDTLAFKDFGARFMSRLLSYFTKDDNEDLVILVATSGDTGSAVARGFYEVDGIRVVVLFPEGRVSELQQRQMTTLGKNITPLSIKGSFDDCQRLVKEAFLDASLHQKLRLTSANSINIARLIPQMLYYFETYRQFQSKGMDTSKLVFSVPSGNFGNLTAGLFAKTLGLPVYQFVASVNDNDVFYQYLQTGEYKPYASKQTISNAMDVGKPSNFARIIDLCSTWNNVKDEIKGFTVNEEETKEQIKSTFSKFNYTACPHTAVGIEGLNRFSQAEGECLGVVLSTAHPAKFKSVVDETLNADINLPNRLEVLKEKQQNYQTMSPAFEDFKSFLMNF